MTSADPGDIVTAASDDVTVEKSFEPDDFPVPAIAFTIRSERDTNVSIRLVDTVPDDVAPENIGFHPKYGAEFWDVEDGRIVFQRDFAPGEEYTTVYGLRGGDADTAAKFMSEPTLESVDPPQSESDDDEDIDTALDAAEIDDMESIENDAAELAVSSETEHAGASKNGSVDNTEVLDIDDATAAVASGDDPDRGDDGEEPSVSDIDPLEDSPETSEDAPSDDEKDGREPEPSGTDHDASSEAATVTDDVSEPNDGSTSSAAHDSLVSELAAEIQEGNVDDDDLMTLRDALGLDLASASVEARIEHLQSELSDLEAYTDALEGFLDEEGDAQTLIAEARDGYDEAIDRIDDLETQITDVQSELDERLEAIDETIDETIDEQLDAEIDDLRSDLQAVEEQLETEADARRAIKSDVDTLSDDVADVAEMRDRLTNALGGLAGGTPSSEASADASEKNGDNAADNDEASDAEEN